jgi:UDP-N-acetylmuramoyl-tripeptide--D-alanyl-D-alanine ligase
VNAPRVTVVFGTFSDTPGADSDKYRQIAREALKIVDRVLFVGPKAGYVRKRITPELEGRLFVMDSAQAAIRYLNEDVIKDELVLIKSGNRDHLERLIYGQSAVLNCWKQYCPKMISCHQCEESGLTCGDGRDES